MGPALKADTSEIVEVDYDQPPGDLGIVPYTVAGLRRAPEGMTAEVETSFDHELWRSYNFCPGCYGYTLTMATHMLVD
jgi:hypothetical protein